MKKFLYSILSIFTVISFFSCNHLSEEKKSDSRLAVRLSNSFDDYSRTITNCPEFDVDGISPYYWDFTVTDSEGRELNKGLDYFYTVVDSAHCFTIALGTYTITAETTSGGNTFYGEETVEIGEESTPPVTIYVGLKKTEEGKGSFSYTIILKKEVLDFSTLTATYELKPLWKDAVEGDTISGVATTIESDGSAEIVIPKTENIKSGFYKLTVRAIFDGVERIVALKDNIVEIADGQETTGEQTALNSSRTYYATTEASSFSGLTEDYPANLVTLIHILAESNAWENAKIYCKNKPNEEAINAEDVAKIQKEILIYYNNEVYITIKNYVYTVFVEVSGAVINGTEEWNPASSVFVADRKLTIPDLIVSDHEVTRGEYKELIGTDPSTAKAYGSDGNLVSGDAVLKHPVNYVSWYDALVYCNKLSIKEDLTPCYTISGLTNPDEWGSVPRSDNTSWNAATCDFTANGYRLPTEAEWEWLARGGENFTYAGSNTVDDVAWYKDNSTSTDGYTGTREVKTKAPNGYGLYDMSGNVWEYCWDWYAATVNSSVAADGPESGTNRVARGSSINGAASTVTCANRDNCITYSRNSGYGFRVVRTKTE